MQFKIPASLDEALGLLADGFRPVAGGTDLVVAARNGKSPLPDKVMSIDRLPELSGITSTTAGLMIGAVVTHAQLMCASSVIEAATALADASALVGSPSTRNVGTIGGNVMNASPAMDTGAPLLVLDAEIVLRSTRGERRIAANEFWTGPGGTVARLDELCTAIAVPTARPHTGSAYVRLEYRRAMEIAVVGAAANVVLDADGSGRIADASVGLTAVAPTIISLEGLSQLLADRTLDEQALVEVAEAASNQAAPISDLRASEAYRRHCIGVMARRAVEAAARRAAGESIAVPVNRSTGIGAAR